MSTTITNSLRHSSPLKLTRPPAEGTSTVPGDSFTASEKPSNTGRWALAAGALVLVGVGALVAPQAVQEQRSVERNSDPITEGQWAQQKALGAARPQDNETAQQVRADYREISEEMLTEADQFQAQSRQLQHEGKRLEWMGKELGNGTHETAGSTVTVQLREDGITVTQQEGDVTRSLVRDGETLTFETSEGQRLEAGEESVSVVDAQTTRTHYLKDTMFHPAGEFEVVTATRSYQQTTRVDGTRVRRETRQLVSGYAGRESISEVKEWKAPDVAIALYPAPELNYSESRQSQNFSLQGTTRTFREVELRQDGSTVTRSDETPDGVTTEGLALKS